MLPSRRSMTLLIAALAATAVACGDNSGPSQQPPAPNTTPASLTITGGNNQSGTIGNALGNPLVVRVTNSDNQPLSGVSVAWSVISGGGALGSTTSTTDGQGEASTSYTLGPNTGTNQVQAAVADMTNISTTFTATGNTPPPPPPPPPPQPSASVTVGDNFYDSNNVTISTGQSVQFNWTGQASHSVTFDPPKNDDSGEKSSGSFTLSFTNSGTFTYFCTVHGRAVMSGTVVVN